MPEQRDPRAVCTRVGLALFCMLLCTVASMQFLIWLVPQAWPWLFRHEYGVYLVNFVSLYGIGAPVFLGILHTVPDGWAPPRQPLRLGPGRLLLLLMLSFGSAYAINMGASIAELLIRLAAYSVQVPEALRDFLVVRSPYEEGSLPLRILLSAVVPALGEEYLFRYTLRRKLRGAGDMVFILYSAFGFGLFHLNFTQSLYAFGGGIIFAWVYARTGVIWHTVLLHFLFNLRGILLGALLQYTEAFLLVFVILLLTQVEINLALVAAFVLPRRESGQMLPPTEPGWPYRMPAPLRRKINAPALVSQVLARMQRPYPWYGAAPGMGGWYQAPPPPPPYIAPVALTDIEQAQLHADSTQPKQSPARFLLLNPGMVAFVLLALGIILLRLLR